MEDVEATEVEDVEAPEIVSLNETELDVEGSSRGWKSQ